METMNSMDSEAPPPVVGVLACDHIVGDDLIEAAEGLDYEHMCGDLVRRHRPSLHVRVYDVVNGELPSWPDECDGWIITGARHDAYRDEPWMVDLRRFIVRLHEQRARTVGLCFGHQIVAHALGGQAGPAGIWKVGPQELTVDPTPWFDGGTVRLHAMHRDEALRLPPGAVEIGTGTTADHPIYMIGDSMLCMQDHPEFTDRYLTALIEARRDRTGDQVADEALKRVAEFDTHGDMVAGWITNFLLDTRR